jgi:serine/threonine protein phosphatase 1
MSRRRCRSRRWQAFQKPFATLYTIGLPSPDPEQIGLPNFLLPEKRLRRTNGLHMLRKLFGTKSKWAPSTPSGCRAYAIGDVHGRLDLLRILLEKIRIDNEARGVARTFLVILGDLIDRGPDSRGVIDLFLDNPPDWAEAVHLKGNHEEFFENVLGGDEAIVLDWLTYGGYDCAESYGLSKGWTLNASPPAIVERLAMQVPASHKAFLQNMADSFRVGDYLFVHAGIRPGVPVDQQTGRDLRWIRDGFLEDQTDHGLMIVHGHTIVKSPEQHRNRIAVDTGAYKSGVLTALGLEGSERWFLDTGSALSIAAE